MNRLFWKFFLSFWIALVLFGAAALLTASRYLDELREQEKATSPYVRLMNNAAEAQAAADQGGIEGLKDWANGIDRSQAVPLMLIDKSGAELLGREVPTWLVERFRRRESQDVPPSRKKPVIRLADGTEYWLFPDFQNVTLGRILYRPRVMAVPVLVAALVGGLVCFLLTRYLTAPIERLRRAAELYATGDLSQRVAPSLGGRRDEIADLALTFDRMAERLTTSMQAQKQLLSDVSHELRSPLARLQAALGLARQRAGNNIQVELERIEREAERLNELLGQVLSLAQLEAGVRSPPMEPVDLTELVETVVDDAALEARGRGCAMRIEQLTPATVYGNAPLLHSTLENVVRNAVKYTASGTTVTLSSTHYPERPDWVMIEVRDYGPGVPEAMLSQLFEPFVRLDDARDRAGGGYGLGLAIAKRAVRLHGGEISARNAQDGGLIVTIGLPGYRHAS